MMHPVLTFWLADVYNTSSTVICLMSKSICSCDKFVVKDAYIIIM